MAVVAHAASNCPSESADNSSLAYVEYGGGETRSISVAPQTPKFPDGTLQQLALLDSIPNLFCCTVTSSLVSLSDLRVGF